MKVITTVNLDEDVLKTLDRRRSGLSRSVALENMLRNEFAGLEATQDE